VIAERAHEMTDALGETLSRRSCPPRRARHSDRPLASLEEAQRTFLARYFRAEVLPALTPLATDVSRPFPRLANLTLNLAILLAPA
jgi:polyphosphate kinase